MTHNNSNGISLWDLSAQETAISSPMTSDIDTDVAIVGGGFTGLSSALHLAEKGVEANVFEANTVGYGGSGRNVGLVNAGLWLPPQDVRNLLGEEIGSNFINILGNAPEYVFSLIEKHKINCEPTRTGTIHAAHSPKGYEDLARRAEEWRRLGAPVDLLSKEEATQKIGSPAFYGGLLDNRAGTINPMGYVRGLGRAAIAAGATINTGVKVLSLKRENNKWLLETTSGLVRANSVVLGTNAYTDTLWPDLKRCFTEINYFQLATEPLGSLAKDILPERQGLWDTGKIMFSLRRDQFDRIIIGSMGKVIGGESGLSEKWAKNNLRRLFPHLHNIKFEKSWHGKIAMTPDHLPRIFRLDENLYTPIGYNGRGITPGTIFGKAMGDLLSGGKEQDLPLPITQLKEKQVSSAPIMSRVYDMAFTANQIIKTF